jgi:hypothetical protein
MRSAGQLTVHPVLQAAEIARFHGLIVCRSTASDCDIWIGAIGADGYDRFYLAREGVGFCARPHRYALAVTGGSVAAGLPGLHECDNPVCVKIAAETDVRGHVVSGSQCDNVERIARMRRGGGRHAVRCFDSRGVQCEDRWRCVTGCAAGGNAAAVEAALLGDKPTLG